MIDKMAPLEHEQNYDVDQSACPDLERIQPPLGTGCFKFFETGWSYTSEERTVPVLERRSGVLAFRDTIVSLR
ncbi:hypothetical protein ACLFMI_14585 [Pseudonocardia nantongensis]|uniref:hypothetical protein n=1 Tax=Pseudonocardia nantongensis TaxID=1181885 RepID=UPI00397A5760